MTCKKCKHVNSRSSLTMHSHRESPYFLLCNCSSCHEVWFLCPLHNRRWSIKNQYHAIQHFRNPSISHVSVEINNLSNENDNTNSEDTMNYNDDTVLDDNITNTNDSHMNLNDTNKFSFMSTNSQQYFKLLTEKDTEIPAQYIVHAAFAQHSSPSSQFCNLFETELHLQATRLCLSTSNMHHTQIATIFNMLQSCINSSENVKKFDTTRLPTSMAEINKFYISKSTSIRKSLPYPTPKEIENHVYVSLNDVLSHLFAYGTKLNGICPYDNHDYLHKYVSNSSNDITQTPFVQDIINDTLQKFPPTGDLKPLILLGTVWSDGFDANNVVHSAPSIWMRTITIAPPQDMKTSTRHTFVLHMSREGICHEQIDNLFCKELCVLEKGQWFIVQYSENRFLLYSRFMYMQQTGQKEEN